MKKYLFLTLFGLVFALNASAQENKKYCMVTCMMKGNGAYSVFLDFGDSKLDGTLGKNESCKPVTPDGKEIKFLSPMMAVNWMADRGWQYVSQESSLQIQTYFIFIMSKQTTPEKLKEGILLKKDYNN